MSQPLSHAEVQAIALDIDRETVSAFTTERHPGAFEAVADEDYITAQCIELIGGHGFADQVAGSTETGVAMYRVDRYVLATDDRGFHALFTFDSAALAEKACDEEDARQNPEED